MQPGLFEHFVADNHKCFLTDCSITLIDKADGLDPTRREEYMKGFKSCGFLWVKYLKLMVTSARFWTFFRGRSLVYVKYILLNHTYVSCKEYYFCILSCSIIFFDGDSNRWRLSQLICIASYCLVSMRCEYFHGGIIEHSVIFSECISLTLSKLFNCI